MRYSKKSFSGKGEIAKFLKKSPEDFSMQDLWRLVERQNIRMLNLNHIPADGRLKTLSFAIKSREHFERIMAFGERVDGSSLFPYIDTENSDLYIVPRLSSAFVNPFSKNPTLNVLCSYFDKSGNELDISSSCVLKKAIFALKKKTGIELLAAGEIEYYSIVKKEPFFMYPCAQQRGYHESKPFVKSHDMNEEILLILHKIGINAKYGHAEVGCIDTEAAVLEQFEIELDLEPLAEMADHIVITKWVIRNVAAAYGREVTFAPKITFGNAGSGMHIHIAAVKKGKNVLIDQNEDLSSTAKSIIGGLLKLSPSITAFGNTVPISYMRLVPYHEAPTNICWGERNRTALIRVPLGWRKIKCFIGEKDKHKRKPVEHATQTIELRSPDSSANSHLLLAAIAVASKHGLLHKDCSKIAKESYVSANVFKSENNGLRAKLLHLPSSCFESASILRAHSGFYLEDGVFPKRLIEGVAKQLESFNDAKIMAEIRNDTKKAKEYVLRFMHCG
ncbi:MAG: glutamine synthetase family protein [Candidatus Diapherotrites archaeon]|nr:glutamine synthetase family protein [Candidatus Diapherotrites archaeon]